MGICNLRLCLGLAAGIALAGCGGSDDSPAAPPAPAPAPTPAPPPAPTPAPPPAPTPAPPPAPAAITVAGTAVKGAALAGAAISVKCAIGNSATTTAASGAYTVTLTGGALPCVVKAVGTDGTTYHSVVPGTGSTGAFAANVSPLTEMVVAHVAGTQPTDYFTAFGSTTSVAATKVTDAISYVQTAMAGLTNLTGVNPLIDPLVVGNSLDVKIDQVMAGLASAGLTVTQVSTAILANPAAPSVVAAPLATAAASCSWFKSGKYRIINRSETDPALRFERVTVNAAALNVTLADNSVTQLASDGACQFGIDEPTATLKVIASSGGLLALHGQSKLIASERDLFFGIPEQTLPASELAGTWNVADWVPEYFGIAGQVVASISEVTIDAAGQVTGVKRCIGLNTCTTESGPFAKFTANASGGFDLVEGGATVGRMFLYKTITGRKVFVLLDDANGLSIGMPQASLGALPAVGTVNNFRQFELGANSAVSALTEDQITVTAVDTATKTITRIRASDSRVDSQAFDKPRDGLRHRALNSCSRNGASINCAEFVQLPLQGMGITLTLSTVVQPTTGTFYQFSINKP